MTSLRLESLDQFLMCNGQDEKRNSAERGPSCSDFRLEFDTVTVQHSPLPRHLPY